MTLTVDEKIKLSHLENTIEEGIKASMAMARALWTIKTEELYRDKYHSFTHYCQVRWNIQERYARYLIDAAESDRLLRAAGTIVQPESEGQIRPIATLPAKQQAEAWQAAVTIAQSDPKYGTGNASPKCSHSRRAAEAVKSKAKTKPPHVGDRVQVLEENSAQYGRTVEVTAVNGVVVECKTDDGQAIALLANEITSGVPEAVSVPTEKPKTQPPKPNQFEKLELELEISKHRVLYLENLLKDCLEVMEEAIGFVANPEMLERVTAIVDEVKEAID